MKRIIVLLYLNEKRENYSYKDLKQILSLDFHEVDNLIQELIEDEFITYIAYNGYKITEEGTNFLESYELDDLSILALLKENFVSDVSMEPDFEGLYIPRDFRSKL